MTVGALLFAPSAMGAVRHASPAGSGTMCTQMTPCSVVQAVNSANDGDEVVIAPGDYNIGTSAVIDTFALNLAIHGVEGQAPPRIIAAGNAVARTVSIDTAGSSIRHVVIDQIGTRFSTLDVSKGAVASRVFAKTTAAYPACTGLGGLIRDSVCLATNSSGLGVGSSVGGLNTPGTLRLRNVTAIASGTNGIGIGVDTAGGSNVTIDAKNVIASGDVYDVQAKTNGVSDVSIVSLSYSNFASVNSTGPGGESITSPSSASNQGTAPLFVNAAAEDYRQAAGSPTIDAGTLDADTGAIDLGGDPRPQGPANDIGAYEAPDSTPPETTITSGPEQGATIADPTPEFGFSASEIGSTFACSLDGGPFTACTTPHTLSPLAPGAHSFAVRATDPAQNQDQTPASRSFAVLDCDALLARVSTLRSKLKKARAKLKRTKAKLHGSRKKSPRRRKLATKAKRQKKRVASVQRKVRSARVAAEPCQPRGA